MPKRRPHHKSRFGCDQCRKRRVKCDEKALRCMNCTNRGDECTFSRKSPQKIHAVNENDSPGSFGPISVTPSSTDLSINPVSSPYTVPGSTTSLHEPISITDVGLMHYWSTRTCHSFTREGSELFREHVGQEALRHDYLMEAIFAMTLLHMASAMEDPEAVRPLVSAALQHQNQSLLGLRTALSNISPSNCDAVFICSVLIMVCAIVSPLLPTDCEQVKPTSETVLLLVEFMNGVSSIVGLVRHWIEQGPLHRFFGVVEPKSTFIGEWAPAADLRHMLDTQISHGSRRQQTLENAIQGLETVFHRETCAVLWIVKVDSDFRSELERGEPIAMMIFMHWGVLLYITDDMWWKKYSGSRLVQELSATLVGYGGDLERMSRWCRKQVGLSG
ncbi:hypothetical protein B0J14DRAFT_589155 [Halenospora varia]|nr:hypothetical protein B0J14DRAFT_589155 [Halenospora varia]